jgi:hypothetical protein
VVSLAGGVVVAVERRVDQIDRPLGFDVGDDADGARPAHGERREDEAVVAGEHVELLVTGALDDFRHLVQVAARGLVAQNVRVRGEFDGRIDLDVPSRPAGDVVDDLGQINLVGDGSVVVVHPRRFGLVVVRRDEEQPVGAGVGRAL